MEDKNFQELEEQLVALETFYDKLVAAEKLDMSLALESEVVTGRADILNRFYSPTTAKQKHSMALEDIVDVIAGAIVALIAILVALFERFVSAFAKTDGNMAWRFRNGLAAGFFIYTSDFDSGFVHSNTAKHIYASHANEGVGRFTSDELNALCNPQYTATLANVNKLVSDARFMKEYRAYTDAVLSIDATRENSDLDKGFDKAESVLETVVAMANSIGTMQATADSKHTATQHELQKQLSSPIEFAKGVWKEYANVFKDQGKSTEQAIGAMADGFDNLVKELRKRSDEYHKLEEQHRRDPSSVEIKPAAIKAVQFRLRNAIRFATAINRLITFLATTAVHLATGTRKIFVFAKQCCDEFSLNRHRYRNLIWDSEAESIALMRVMKDFDSAMNGKY